MTCKCGHTRHRHRDGNGPCDGCIEPYCYGFEAKTFAAFLVVCALLGVCLAIALR